MQKELDDYVRGSLEALSGDNFDWEQFEGLVWSLVDKVAVMCEANMDAQPTSRSVNPNQCWRWRQQQKKKSTLGCSESTMHGHLTPPMQPLKIGNMDNVAQMVTTVLETAFTMCMILLSLVCHCIAQVSFNTT